MKLTTRQLAEILDVPIRNMPYRRDHKSVPPGKQEMADGIACWFYAAPAVRAWIVVEKNKAVKKADECLARLDKLIEEGEK